jgi:UDP-glucose-4-epimerase GalE
MKKILVTGGAGYIGSHTLRQLIRKGYEVTVVDDLSRGHRESIGDVELIAMRVQETERLAALLKNGYDAVVHFAAFIEVGESMRMPEVYFENNTGGTISLLKAMVQAGVKKLIFSSTAAVYGTPRNSPITEEHPHAPVSVYGETKALVERMLPSFDASHGLRSVTLRYFNACGADPSSEIGENHTPETHLLPLVLRAVESGKPLKLYGNDYPTPDGTCVRDYIHVNDLAEAHVAALDALAGGEASDHFNVGTGVGHSIMEMFEAVQEVTGREVPYVLAPRRDGDPAELVADSTKLRGSLGWKPRYPELREIVGTAWKYEQARRGLEAGSLTQRR